MNAFEKLQSIANGFQAASVLAAGCELDLFTELVRNPGQSTDELVENLRLDRRGLSVLLDALEFLGFVERSDGRWNVASDYIELLDSRNPKTAVPILCHLSGCQRRWSGLAWTVKSGVPTPQTCSVNGPLADYQAFVCGMNSLAIQTAPPLAAKMKDAGLLNFSTVLDVGGATGTFAKAFLDLNPQGDAIVFDLPPAIDAARKLLKGSPYESRLSLVEGNFYENELPGGVDFLWLSAIVHQQDNVATLDLLKKCRRALVSGGKIAVRDIFIGDSGPKSQAAVIFAVNMLCNTNRGKVYFAAEMFELLKQAGFQNPTLAIPADDMTAVIVAEK